MNTIMPIKLAYQVSNVPYFFLVTQFTVMLVGLHFLDVMNLMST